MGVDTFVQPDYSSQSGSAYPTGIDKAVKVLQEIAAAFAPHEASAPNLTLKVDAGRLQAADALVSQSQQTVSGFAATGANQRIDRVVLDAATGAASRVAGTESASPAAPAIPAGYLACCQVGPFTTSTTQITNSMITDERTLDAPPDDVATDMYLHAAFGGL